MTDVGFTPESYAQEGSVDASAMATIRFAHLEGPGQFPSRTAGSDSTSSGGNTTASVDWDHRGRVIRSRFVDGQVCQFRYDESGALYGFIYARLAWSTVDQHIWTAHDSSNSYTLYGKVRVNVDGTITVTREDRARTLRLNGLIVDVYNDGHIVEGDRKGMDPRPADLFAEAERRDGPPTEQDFGVLPPSSCSIDDAPSSQAASNDDEKKIEELPKPQPQRRSLAIGKRMNKLRAHDEVDASQRITTSAAGPKSGSPFAIKVQEWKVRALEIVRGRDNIALAPALDALAELYSQSRRINEAREVHERALRIRRQNLGEQHADTTINLYGLGRIYHEWGRYTEAQDQYAQAIRLSGNGLQKARFMRELGITDDAHILEHIKRLLMALLALSQLYGEQKKWHLCAELLNTSQNVRNSIDSKYHRPFEPIFKSLADLAISATPAAKNPPRGHDAGAARKVTMKTRVLA